MMKKILIALFVVFNMLFFSPTNNIAFAKKDCSKEDSFFGLPAWYRGLVDKGTCQIKKINQKNGSTYKTDSEVSLQVFIWSIIGNIADMIMRLIGVISAGFIIYGGYQYMLSVGDSSKMAKAKVTITNAVVGLIIAIIASGIVSYLMSNIK